ncbi:MAG: hypothetical protein A2Y21_00245, partial [Clostridiales bacterium GWC2_40_7]
MAYRKQENGMQWWREAKFGMFIHWGLYSIPAGEWDGRKAKMVEAEWIMNYLKISIAEYEKLASRFNPLKFDAEEWVLLAKKAGMKYIIFTAKHHDGFAMYHSKCDHFNIMDATPFGRDPVAELAQACSRHGLVLCLYYSHDLDWHEKDGGGYDFGGWWDLSSISNDWDFPDLYEKDYSRYFHKKVIPQIQELLTQYGPIGLLWFDIGITPTNAQCTEVYELVKRLQPDCIVNSRLGHGFGDYEALGDNEIPVFACKNTTEAISTMNNSWGYNKYDQNWKSSRELIRTLSGLAGKGVNWTLNVGPTSEGLIPESNIRILEDISRWTKVNGEAIYGTRPADFACDPLWGAVTLKPGKIYIHMHRSQEGIIAVNGIKSRIRKAYLLNDQEKLLNMTQKKETAMDWHQLEVEIPADLGKQTIPVLVLETDEVIEMQNGLIQQGDGTVFLSAA